MSGPMKPSMTQSVSFPWVSAIMRHKAFNNARMNERVENRTWQSSFVE